MNRHNEGNIKIVVQHTTYCILYDIKKNIHLCLVFYIFEISMTNKVLNKYNYNTY